MRRNTQSQPAYSHEHSYIAPRNVRAMELGREDVEDYQELARLGIVLDEASVQDMASYAMDDTGPALITTASISTPVQFLQNWLPGFVNIITGERAIDELIGIQVAGSWEDEEVVQGVLEMTGKPQPYGDYTNIPLSSWNANYERRSVVRFEEGMRIGVLEAARASRANINDAGTKREAAALALEINRNNVGFYGFNGGANRTYGMLNDPNLPAYVPNPGPAWSTATFLEISTDIRTALTGLRTQSKGTINPFKTAITLAIALSSVDYLGVMNTLGTQSVMDWLKQTYPNVRVVAVPEFDSANGGSNVMYAYAEKVDDNSTDGGRVWAQIVPAKFKTLGVEQQAKAYIEDYTNALAGVLLKRPYAVYRMTGLS